MAEVAQQTEQDTQAAAGRDGGGGAVGSDGKEPIEVTLERKPGVGFGFSIYGGQMLPGSLILLPVRICKLKPNTPASQSGKVKIDHRIISINGVDVSGAGHAEVVSLLKKSPDTLVLRLQDDIEEQQSILKHQLRRTSTAAQSRPASTANQATGAKAVDQQQQKQQQQKQQQQQQQQAAPHLAPSSQAYLPGKSDDRGKDGALAAAKAVNETVRMMFNFNGTPPTELTLQTGDFVHVSIRRDDGWCVGRCHRTGQQGLFPGNFASKVRLKQAPAGESIYDEIDNVVDEGENIYEELGHEQSGNGSNKTSRPHTPPASDGRTSAHQSQQEGAEEEIYQPMRDQVVRQTDHAIELANGDVYAVVAKPASKKGEAEDVYSVARPDTMGAPQYVYDGDDDSMLYAKLETVNSEDGPPPIPDRKYDASLVPEAHYQHPDSIYEALYDSVDDRQSVAYVTTSDMGTVDDTYASLPSSLLYAALPMVAPPAHQDASERNTDAGVQPPEIDLTSHPSSQVRDKAQGAQGGAGSNSSNTEPQEAANKSDSDEKSPRPSSSSVSPSKSPSKEALADGAAARKLARREKKELKKKKKEEEKERKRREKEEKKRIKKEHKEQKQQAKLEKQRSKQEMRERTGSSRRFTFRRRNGSGAGGGTAAEDKGKAGTEEGAVSESGADSGKDGTNGADTATATKDSASPSS